MSETIRTANFSQANLKERTQIETDVVAGVQTVTVLNSSGYAVGDKVLLGAVGAETAEVLTIQGITGKDITFTTVLTNRHTKYEEMILLEGDQVRLYRASNTDGNIPLDASFSYLNVYAVIQGDDTSSDLTDPTGGSAYWYKTTYYNSTTGAETSLALSVAVRGANYGRLVSIESIREETGLTNNQNLSDSIFAERRDQAESEVLGRLASAGYTVPFQSTNGSLYVPAIVENIARLLAAGYVLSQQFQPASSEDVNPGKGKIKQAHQLLDDIQNSKLVLLDPTGVILLRTSQVSGWPDNTTQYVGTDGVNGEPFQVTMSKVF